MVVRVDGIPGLHEMAREVGVALRVLRHPVRDLDDALRGDALIRQPLANGQQNAVGGGDGDGQSAQTRSQARIAVVASGAYRRRRLAGEPGA